MMELTISRLKNAVPLLLRKAKKQLAALKSKKRSDAQETHDNKNGLEDLKKLERENINQWKYNPLQALLAGFELKRYFDSSNFADLTIKTSEKEFKVHKIILASQSEYFARMLGGEWKETVDNLVLFEEEDPRVIEAMIRFVYESDYQHDDETTQGVIFHTMVYAAGEKYGIPSLKTHAASKFKSMLDCSFETIDLPLVVAAVYTTTVSTDRELRNCFGPVINRHIRKLMGDEMFIELLEQYPTFSVDILKLLKCDYCRRVLTSYES
ncbi:hypothetical protein FQN50_001141 [Emmonsiellopsis sp. PD_5]|nr:hypothetical protein FQN50_001141 [Emmonsiellopsis sp. PD_5]